MYTQMIIQNRNGTMLFLSHYGIYSLFLLKVIGYSTSRSILIELISLRLMEIFVAFIFHYYKMWDPKHHQSPWRGDPGILPPVHLTILFYPFPVRLFLRLREKLTPNDSYLLSFLLFFFSLPASWGLGKVENWNENFFFFFAKVGWLAWMPIWASRWTLWDNTVHTVFRGRGAVFPVWKMWMLAETG